LFSLIIEYTGAAWPWKRINGSGFTFKHSYP